ncbi:retrovirus-related Pol polyprotein from transposon 297 [Trichonephila clavipes]|nr:retrovirus-related Pol polyprotein from transposon 297 [Trichonephila clavipes]
MPTVSKYPNEIVTLDLLGPYPTSRPERYKFILVISDHFTKWCELIPVPKASAQAIANALFDNYIARYGVPISLISDNGPQFISDEFEHLSHRLDIKHMKTVTYRPQVNLTERVNRNLVQRIASFVEENHENRTNFFMSSLSRCVLRKLINVTEETKYVGRNIERLFDEARRNMRKKHKSWEKYYNCRRRDVHIKVSDLVLIQTHFLSAAGRKQVEKFMPKFEGPYRVLEVKGNNFIIWKSGKRVTVNVDQIRVYRPRQTDTISSDSQSNPGRKVVDVITRPARPDNNEGRNKQAERPVRSNQATTREILPILSTQPSEGKRRNLRSRGTSKSTASLIRRRSLSMEALDGDPVVETGQTREEPAEIMDTNHDNESKFEKSDRHETFLLKGSYSNAI